MRNADHSEDGAVLIIVMGLIVLVSLLALSMIALSQATYRLSVVECARGKASYLAEDAAARMIWLLRDDIFNHPNRTLGVANETDGLGAQIHADGTVYKILNADDVSVSVSIYDAIAGFDVSGTRPSGSLRGVLDMFPDGDERRIEYMSFLNALDDYVDTNDFVRANGGFEVDDFSAMEKFPLPRNRPMRYKWEVCWIPGCSNFFTSDSVGRMPEFRIISPNGRRLRGRGNFFSASTIELKVVGKLSDDEVSSVVEARRAWRRDRVPLSESLALGLLGRLNRRFSFRESGNYTFFIEVPVGVDGGLRILTVTLRITKYLTSGKNLVYYEWRFLR